MSTTSLPDRPAGRAPGAGRLRLAIGGPPRYRSRLDDEDDAPERALGEIVAGATAAREWLLTRGEPTLRRDLPELLAALRRAGGARLGMRTDGWALTSERVVRALLEAGLAFVVIPLPSARADAHDWLTGQPGSSRRVLKAIAACAAGGLRVEVELPLVRPTLPHAPETVEAAARLGASAVRLRRLVARGAAADDFIALSPRLQQLRPAEEAVVRALELGLGATLEGIPRCFLRATADSVAVDEPAGEAARCDRCPGPDACGGLPEDYFARFGAGELRTPPPPPSSPPPESIAVVVDPRESSRSAGLRIARAAQLRPRALRLVDVFEHPDRVELIREALRLDVGVEVAGELRGLAQVVGRELLHVGRVKRLDAALRPGGDLAPTLAALARHRGAGAYGLIGSADELPRWTAAWADGTIPGAPAFRLLPRGGSLAALARAALPQPEGVRRALLPLVPACLHDEEGVAPFTPTDTPWWGATPTERAGAPNDRAGAFEPCPEREGCARAARCPGLARGWDAAGIGRR